MYVCVCLSLYVCLSEFVCIFVCVSVLECVCACFSYYCDLSINLYNLSSIPA